MNVCICFLCDSSLHFPFSIEERSSSENAPTHYSLMQWPLGLCTWDQRTLLRRWVSQSEGCSLVLNIVSGRSSVASRTHSCCNVGMLCSNVLCKSLLAKSSQWQSLITHRGPYDACRGVQLLITALLGQIYGALSKVIRPHTMTLCDDALNRSVEQNHPHYEPGLPADGLLLGETLWHDR